MNRATLGVIGGLGPIATAHFMELVIAMTDASTDQQHIDMIIYNCPTIPDRTGYILDHTRPNPLPDIIRIGQALARQGAGHIAIPCITAHYFHDQLAAAIPVPIIHIVKETVAHLLAAGIRRVGIMATDGTVQSGLFQQELAAAGLEALVPSPANQREVMALIYDGVKAGKPADMARFAAIRDDLVAQGAQCIILGCTELSLIKRDEVIGPGFLDAMEVLAQQAVLRCGGTLKPAYRTLITT